MPKRPSLSAIKRQIQRIEQEGYLLQCWIALYRPRGTARGDSRYYQLRSRQSFANGKKTRHLKAHEVAVYQQKVENGRLLTKLQRQLAKLEQRGYTTHEALTSSATDEWYTPPAYIDLAREVMSGIDLDPASNDVAQQWIQASRYYTLNDSGLLQPWNGRLWLNPPYGQQIAQWTAKAIAEYRSGRVTQAILLVRSAVSSAWFQTLASQFPRCETHKRIRFIDANGRQQTSPVHGNVFFYLGTDLQRFGRIFAPIGTINVPLLNPT